MVLFNYSTRELTAKIVYYGPGLCGKTTNLQFVHQQLPQDVRGKMLSLATKTDRTLFFDFLPVDLGEIRGMKTRVQLYTVPGQVFYNETRKLVLKGADGIVFVADSQKEMLGANIESFKNLEENLKTHGLVLADTPHVIQFNKRDLPKLSSCEELNAALNRYNAPFYESVATTGIGVHETLKAITKLVLLHLTQRYEGQQASDETPDRPARPAAAAAPASVPLATPAAAGPPAVQPTAMTEPPPAAAAAAATSAEPAFDDEIDGLVDEVQDVQPAAGAQPAAAKPAAPERAPAKGKRAKQPTAPAASSAATATAVAAAPRAGVTLTDALADSALFDDPSLEVAELAQGQEREIVVPVELGGGDGSRRFKLSVRLRLDPVD